MLCQNPNGQNNINYANPKGYTPLIVAAQEGHIEVVRWLLSHPNIDVDCRTLQGFNAFDEAACEGHLQIIKLIYQHLLTVKTPLEVEHFVNTGGWEGRTPFHCACLKGDENVVKYLVNVVKVDISKKDNDNKTGSHYAFEQGHELMFLWLAHRDKTIIKETFAPVKLRGTDQKYIDNDTKLNLFAILGEEPDDEIRKLMFRVCRALQREYGDIANSVIHRFITFVREHEFNVNLETLTEELQRAVSESHFIEHLASEFPSVFGTVSEKQKLRNLFSSARNGMWSMSILVTIQWILALANLAQVDADIVAMINLCALTCL